MTSNVYGEPLDSLRFRPIFETLSKMRVALLLHPTIPMASNFSQEYSLDLTFGWPFDTSIAMARLVYVGVMARFESLRFVAAHSGGMVPFYRGRISDVQGQYEKEMQTELKRRPRHYFKRFFMDTAAFDSDALDCVYSFTGRGGIVFGTDYPFGAEAGRQVIEQAIRGAKGMKLGKKEREMIFGLNPKVLLNLPRRRGREADSCSTMD